MGTQELGLEEVTDVMIALNSYQKLSSWVNRLSKDQESLKMWYDQQLKIHGDKEQYIGQDWYRAWTDIELHVINQTWSSTACGWGGIGGQAFTSSYTTVIVNYNMNCACIYWGGKLAYIVWTDDKWRQYIMKNGYAMPSRTDSGKLLSLVYKKQ